MEARLNKKQIWLYKMRAEREAMVTVTMLIKSRFQGVVDMMLGMINYSITI